jgi:hypothetical protein
MKYDRQEVRRRIGRTYRPVEAAPCCVYCGATGKLGQDHVPPLSVAGWVKEERLIYPACVLCNTLASTYPVVCVERRAEFLLCRMRAEWVKVKGGKVKLWSFDQLRAGAEGIKARLASGVIRRECRCRVCR